MKISVSLGHLDRAVRQLEKYAKKLEQCPEEIDRRLSEIAADEARTHFRGGVTVSAEPHGVIATGDSVVFQEFGAGARISDPFPDGADVDFEVRRGAYSDLHEGPYAESGYEYWTFGGRRYEYVTPTNAMFHGMMEARAQAGAVVKEVLNE